MNKRHSNAHVLFAACLSLAECAGSETSQGQTRTVALHESVIVSLGLLLFLLTVFLFWQGRQQEKRVEFTVFNSQYIGKESVRSSSEHDFPNFDLDIFKNQVNQQEEAEQRSSQRRRRRRKVDRLQKNAELEGKNDAAITDNLQ